MTRRVAGADGREPAPSWERVLGDLGADSRERQRAACEAALGNIAGAPERLAVLRDLLRSGQPRERFGAAWVLFRARRPGLALLPALIDALALPDGDRRWEAAQMLVALGRLEPQVAPVVLDLAQSSDTAARRRMALFVLRELAPDAPETLRVLLGRLDDRDPTVRRAALSSLVKLTPADPSALERTLGILRADADPRMQLLATAVSVELAAQLPERTAEVRTALLASQDADPRLARAAALALRRLPNQE